MTQTSPVATSCSSSLRFAAPLLSISFFMVATGTSVRPRKSERGEKRRVALIRRKLVACCPPLTVWRELVFLKHSDAQDVLVDVFDEELAAEVPLWVQGVADGAGGVALSSHRQLAVRVAFTWKRRVLIEMTAGGRARGSPRRSYRWVCRL